MPSPLKSGPASKKDGAAVNSDRDLAALLDRDPSVILANLSDRHRAFDEVLSGHIPTVVVPAARMGRLAAAALTAMGVEVVAFGDRDSGLNGGRIDGLPVLTPAEIAVAHRRDACLVASTMYDSDIADDLRARGCEVVFPVGYLNLRLPEVFKAREYEGAWRASTDSANRPFIERAYGLFDDDESRRAFLGKLAFYRTLDKKQLDDIRSTATMYFDPTVYRLLPDEVVVDGGAFVGDTLNSFLRACSGRFRSYSAFEPDAANFAALSEVAATDPLRIEAVRAGLARSTTTARFLSTGGVDSRMVTGRGGEGDGQGDDESIPVISLDDYFEGRQAPTLIKMDIEGAEEDALLGATRLLARNRSTLAVSAYHFPADLWTIPSLIKRLMPRSRVFLRHYTREVDDTVCYVIPSDRDTAG